MRAAHLTLAMIAALSFATATLPAAAQAQSFGPVISVNGAGITGFELEQRAALIKILGGREEPMAQAERDLIEERLKVHKAKQAGVSLSREAIMAGMDEFAARANLNAEQFVAALEQEGVAAQTFRDFIESGLIWREYVRKTYAGKVAVSEGEIDRAMQVEAERGAGTRVLVSEFILPVPEGREAEAQAIAAQVAGARDESEFAGYAREYSATASRGQGGRLAWMPLEELPPVLRPVLMALKPGQTTQPMQIPGAVAVFMLRGIDEGGPVARGEQVLDYAEYLIPDVASAAGAAKLAELRATAKSCTDLYTANKGQSAALLTLHSQPLPQIPADVALALAPLDTGEASVALKRGPNSLYLMLCARKRPEAAEAVEAPKADAAAQTRIKPANPLEIPLTAQQQDELDRAKSRGALRERLVNEKLTKLVEGEIAEMRANAVIKR